MKKRDWLTGFVFTVTAIGAEEEIVVHVHNTANVLQGEIRRAENEAGLMFQKAGIRVQWVDCPSHVDDEACREPDDPRLFVVTINAKYPPKQSVEALGYALLPGRGNHAAAYYPNIAEAMAGHPEYRASVLGSVIAHELGHLLFHSTRHGEGIMRTNWNRSDYSAMAQRQVQFSAQQAQALRDGLEMRIQGWQTADAVLTESQITAGLMVLK
jgi:hypothetical protein